MIYVFNNVQIKAISVAENAIIHDVAFAPWEEVYNALYSIPHDRFGINRILMQNMQGQIKRLKKQRVG
jgi:hypothetical protein